MKVLRLKETYPTAKVERWWEDEHRSRASKSRSFAKCGAHRTEAAGEGTSAI